VLLQLLGPDEKPKKETKGTAKKRARKKGKKAARAEETAPAEELNQAEQGAESTDKGKTDK
jgi:hypothetical protein